MNISILKLNKKDLILQKRDEKKIHFCTQNERKKVKDRSERKNRAFITQKMKYEDKNVIRLT